MHIPKLRCQEPVGPCSACKERPQLASPAQVEKPEGPSRAPHRQLSGAAGQSGCPLSSRTVCVCSQELCSSHPWLHLRIIRKAYENPQLQAVVRA